MSRSVSVASIPRLRSTRRTSPEQEDDRPSHRRSWSLGPLGRKMRLSRPSSLLRRSTDAQEERDTFSNRPLTWLGPGEDIPRAHASSQPLPQTIYLDPEASYETPPAFPEPPSTSPLNTDGIVDSHLGVLPSPAPTSIHNRSQTDLIREMEHDPLPLNAQEEVLRSVMRHASPPVNVVQLQAVQGIDPGAVSPIAGQRDLLNGVMPDFDPDRTLTSGVSSDEFKKEIEDVETDDESSEDSDPFSEEVELGTGVEARVIKDGGVSPVGARAPPRSRLGSAEVSPVSDTARNRDRFGVITQQQRLPKEASPQTLTGLEKEMRVETQEMESSDEERTSLDAVAGAQEMTTSNINGGDVTNNRGNGVELVDPGPNRGERLYHDGSSGTAVDEDEPRPARFSFEAEDQASTSNADGTVAYDLDDPAARDSSASRTTAPPTRIELPAPTQAFGHLTNPEDVSDDNSSISLPGDIVLTPTVQASQNPTPIFDRPAQFEDQPTIRPSPPLKDEPPSREPHQPPAITTRQVRRDSPMNGYDAVPGAHMPYEQKRQPSVLQALSNAVANGSATATAPKQRSERYVVRVVAAPEVPRYSTQLSQGTATAKELPPPPPPKDRPITTAPFNGQHGKGKMPPRVKTNVQVLDVAIPSPSVSLRYEPRDETCQPSTPQKFQNSKVNPPSASRSAASPSMLDDTLVEEDPTVNGTGSSLRQHKLNVEEAMVPLKLHPAMRDSTRTVPTAALGDTSGKNKQAVGAAGVADNDGIAYAASDDDLYGAPTPPASNVERLDFAHDQQASPSGLGPRRVSPQPGPPQQDIITPNNGYKHHAKHSSGNNIEDRVRNAYSKHSRNDRASVASISSEESRPMSFVRAHRDDKGQAIERISSVSRSQKPTEDRVSRVGKRNEPKSLIEEENRSSLGELAVHQQFGPQQNAFPQTHKPLKEEDIPIQRTITEEPVDESFASSADTTSQRPVQPIQPDITNQAGPAQTSPKGGRPRHNPIFQPDSTPDHIAYQLASYREATKKALALKLESDPSFEREAEGSSDPAPQPMHRVEFNKKGSAKPNTISFLEPTYKLKGKAAGVFKVLKGPTPASEPYRSSESEPRASSGSAGSVASARKAQHLSMLSLPDSGKKKRFSGMQAMFKRPTSSDANNGPNPLKMFKTESKAKTAASSSAQMYQPVRIQPAASSERPHASSSANGRSSRQSDKYGEGDLLRDDDDEFLDEDDEEEDYALIHGNGFSKPGNTLSAIEEVHVSPIDSRAPLRGETMPYRGEQGMPIPPLEPKYDQVSIPAGYDRSFHHLHDNSNTSTTMPSPPIDAAATWRRDPRDPFKGPSKGPPRNLQLADTYAAGVATDQPDRAMQSISPPLVSPMQTTSDPPAHRRLFGKGIVSGLLNQSNGSGEDASGKQKKSKKKKHESHQESPFLITMPGGSQNISEEEEENRRTHRMSFQQRPPKVSQILGAPAQQEQNILSTGGPAMQAQTSPPLSGFGFAADGPQLPPGFRFAPEQPHLPTHMQNQMYAFAQAQSQPPMQSHAFVQPQPPSSVQSYPPPHPHSYAHPHSQPLPQAHPFVQPPQHHPHTQSPQTQQSSQAPPLPGYREILPRDAQHASTVLGPPSRTQPSPAQPQHQYYPPPQTLHHNASPEPPGSKLHSSNPVQPPRSTILPNSDSSNASFLADATPVSSAHPTRNSAVFPEPGADGVPNVPSVPMIHSVSTVPSSTDETSANSSLPPATEHIALPITENPRESLLTPQATASARDSNLAPQVDDAPRDSAHASQTLPPKTATETKDDIENSVKSPIGAADVALPSTPGVMSPVVPGAKEIPILPLPPVISSAGESAVGLDAQEASPPHMKPSEDPTDDSVTPTEPLSSAASVAPSTSTLIEAQQPADSDTHKEVHHAPHNLPLGIAELSAVPREEDEYEPVMSATSYPGMEWMPTWEE